MSCLQEQDFMGTEYFIPKRHWHPADTPMRNTHSRNTHFDTRALYWPNQKYLLFWEVNGGQGPWGRTGQTFICEKTMGERHCLKSYRNGALLHISTVSLGFSALPVPVDVEWITTAAWWSSKPWTHFLVLSNGETQRMWLIRESSSPWQIFSNGNGFWGLLAAEGEAAE